MSQVKITSRWIYPSTAYRCNFCESLQKPGIKKRKCQKTRFLESDLFGQPLLSLMVCKECWTSSIKKEAIINGFIEVNKEEATRIFENKPKQIKGGKVMLPNGKEIDPPPRSK